jgi:hypothetical protein
VRPSKVDRSPPDPRDDPEAKSVEVYVSVHDDGRGALWRGLRYLGLAAVLVAAIVVLLVSTLPSGAGDSRLASSAPPKSLPTSSNLPPLARNVLLLVSHPYLKYDAKQLVSHDPCAESRSAAVERKHEVLYAQAVAEATGEVLPGRAKLQATKYPSC